MISTGISRFRLITTTLISIFSFFIGTVLGPSIGIIIPEALKPQLYMAVVGGQKEHGSIVEENTITEFITLKITANNNGFMPGFIDNVEFIPLSPAAQTATLKAVSIEKPRIWIFSKDKTINLRISSTVPINETTTDSDLQFEIQLSDNYKQQTLGEPIKLRVVIKDTSKKPSELYEALEATKARLLISKKREREIISKTIETMVNESDAFAKVATMYEQGRLLPHDIVEAIHWYKAASTRGQKDSNEKIKELEDPLFGKLSLRKKVLNVVYIINKKRELLETLYSTVDREKLKPQALVKADLDPFVAGKKYKPGIYKAILCVNADHRVNESDNSNNCKEFDLSVLSGS